MSFFKKKILIINEQRKIESELFIDPYKYRKGLRNAKCNYATTKGFTIH